MNSTVFVFRQMAIFFSVLVFAAVNPTTSSETEKYEPLYVIDEIKRFSVASSMIFNEKHFLVSRKSRNIAAACPKREAEEADGITLEVVGANVAKRMPWSLICDNPVKFLIKKIPKSESYSVGFVVYKERGNYSGLELNDNLPQNHNFISFLIFDLDRKGLRTVYVWHSINFGEFIQIESKEPINNKEYEKNQDIYRLDVDEVYEWEHQRSIFSTVFQDNLPCALVKIQLAPAEDFLLQNYKMASRVNLNTTPIWEKLLPQWRSLETFIRKVARILGRLKIGTGTFGTLQWLDPSGIFKDVSLHGSQKFAVSRFLWKAVILHSSNVNFGILFIMYNHPNSSSPNTKNEQLLCPDIIDTTGWNLHTEQQPDEELTSQIYACELTQDNINSLKGEKLPIPKYKVFNLYKVLKPYHDDKLGRTGFQKINVIKELREKNLQP